jgi:hypothetical protein
MPMCGGMGASFHFPPHDHSLLTSQYTALDFVSDALPGQVPKRGEARDHRHALLSIFPAKL